MNKTAYFDDILAQALNLLQVGVLFKYIKDQAEGLLKGEGLGGDSAGVFFVGGALAAIGPALFTAMYECVQKFFVLYRKLRVAKAKVRDITNLANAADPAVMVKRKERALSTPFWTLSSATPSASASRCVCALTHHHVCVLYTAKTHARHLRRNACCRTRARARTHTHTHKLQP